MVSAARCEHSWWTRPALAGVYRLELAAGLGCTSDYILCRRSRYTRIDLADAEQPVKERKPKSKAAKAPLTAEEAEEVARQKKVGRGTDLLQGDAGGDAPRRAGLRGSPP